MAVNNAWFVVLDAALVAWTVSLSACAQHGDDVAYISEFILHCKRSAATSFIPWLCVVVFGAVVLVQFWWMYRVAGACFRKSSATFSNCDEARGDDAEAGSACVGERVFLCCALTAVLGFLFVVRFDWRETSALEIAMHRLGVVALSVGIFLTLHLIWVHLKAAQSNDRLRDTGMELVSWVEWAEYDVLFIAVLLVFMVTSLLGTNRTVSVVCEYVAFGMLFVQTTWLFLVCCERKAGKRIGEISGTAASFAWSLLLLLGAYAAEAVVVLAVALASRPDAVVVVTVAGSTSMSNSSGAVVNASALVNQSGRT